MANALKKINYEEYLVIALTPEGADVTLNTRAAMGLCRGGTIPAKAPLAWLGLFWLALISVPCIYFWGDLRFIAVSIFLAWMGARRSKRAAVAAAWREIKGKGALPLERRREIYTFLTANDLLYLPEKSGNAFG